MNVLGRIKSEYWKKSIVLLKLERNETTNFQLNIYDTHNAIFEFEDFLDVSWMKTWIP